MGFLDKLKKFFAGSPSTSMMDIVVRCKRCGEIIRGQVNLNNDLSINYDGDTATYFCRKGLVGSGENHCYSEVIVEYTFDANRNLIDRRIQGGEFVDEE